MRCEFIWHVWKELASKLFCPAGFFGGARNNVFAFILKDFLLLGSPIQIDGKEADFPQPFNM